jgi:hypothetical protein
VISEARQVTMGLGCSFGCESRVPIFDRVTVNSEVQKLRLDEPTFHAPDGPFLQNPLAFSELPALRRACVTLATFAVVATEGIYSKAFLA